MNVHASGIERRWRAPIMPSCHAAFSEGAMTGAFLGGSSAPRGAKYSDAMWRSMPCASRGRIATRARLSGQKRIDGEDLAWQLRCLAHSCLLDCGLDAVQ